MKEFRNWPLKSNLKTSIELITSAVWETRGRESIEVDNKSWSYLWRSKCGRAELRLHFNKAVAWIKYPVRIPRSENDQFEAQSDNTKKRFASKYIYKYTICEQEMSIMNSPPAWSQLLSKMMAILSDESMSTAQKIELQVNLPEAMPLSCQSTHMHRFDDIPVASEPKVILIDNMWFK